MKKTTCPDCGIEISNNNIKNHIGSKTCLKNQQGVIQGVCKHCKIDTSEMNPKVAANHVRWCKKNPKRSEYVDKLSNAHASRIGGSAWNKGLTKDTDERIKIAANSLKEKYECGDLIPANKGYIKSTVEKEVDRQAALKSGHQRVCKTTIKYKCKDGSIVKMDSSWEVIMAESLDENNIVWTRPTPLPWIDEKGVKHNYFPDFYVPEWDVFLDPKNDWVIKTQAPKLKCLREQYNNIFILGKGDLNVERVLEMIK